MRLSKVCGTAMLLLSTLAAAEEAGDSARPPPYLDDRSGAEALVQSLYNAVNRREFARAWSYFSVPPARNYGQFVAGYDDTQTVEVVTGRPIADGAAGSVYYQVPTALRATGRDGTEVAFAGCYLLRAVDPQLQEPPFRPLAIEKGALKPVEQIGFLANALPASCDGRQADSETPQQLTDRVVDLFRRQHRDDCNLIEDQRSFLSGRQPEIFELRYRYGHETAADEEHRATLFRFDCATYAYNVSEAYYLANQYGEIEAVAFAEPDLDIDYVDDSNIAVKSLVVAGMGSTHLLVNSHYDPATQTITSYSKWRGFGDAFSAGTWTFRGGRFVLTAFAVDAAYDERQEPADVLGFPIAPAR